MPSLTLIQGKARLKQVIQTGLRHRDYKRVCKMAKDYKAYITGEDVEGLLRQFVPRESAELFKQRVAITSLTTPDIANTISTPMYKLGRTSADSSMTWKNIESTAKNRSTLTDYLNKFWGGSSVDKYLTYRMPSMDLTDPNSFIVVEFEEAVDPAKPDTRANPYPFEVNAKEAIDYKYINNSLQYLIVLNEEETKHTIYLENHSVVAIEFTKEEMAGIITAFPKAEIWYKDEKDKQNSPMYYVLEYNHKAGRMPAKRVGSILDIETRGRTCVPMIHPAKPYFEKAIKTVSEFDLTNALHTFPKVFRYGNKCPGDMKKGIICDSGKNLSDDTDCPVCKGSGWSNQTTTASEVIVAAPKDMKDMVSLELMMTYKAPPIDLVAFQKQYGLFDLKQLAIKAVYNGDTYVSDTVVATATAKNIDLESVYDTLKPFGDNWSAMWVHIVSLTAIYLDLGTDLTVTHSFAKDFKMKSLAMLLSDLTLANTSGAPSYIKQSIAHDLAKKVYVDQPSELLKIQTKEKFFPFNGKSENEINYILANDLVSNFDKTFYAKFDNIFFEIEQEQSKLSLNFYDMEYQKQKDLIKIKVDEYLAVIETEGAEGRAMSFNAPGGAQEVAVA